MRQIAALRRLEAIPMGGLFEDHSTYGMIDEVLLLPFSASTTVQTFGQKKYERISDSHTWI